MIRYLSLFSGIEAASVAWKSIGWECAAVAEVDPFCCALLKHHYPGVPNLGDVTKICPEALAGLGQIDLVVFGSPCQDLSVAGKRAGLKGERSGLFFTAIDIVRWSGARYALWENVPGAFSSNTGRDFAVVVGEMAGVELDIPRNGWGNTGVAVGPDGLVEWCVLDAQWFGVPQRRRRIFALRRAGDWRNQPPILFERHCLQGHPPPSREAREGVAPTIRARTKGGGGLGTDFDCDGGLVPWLPQGYRIQNPKAASETISCNPAEGMRVSPVLDPVAFSCKDHGADAGEIAPTLRSMGHDGSHANAGGQVAVALAIRGRDGVPQIEMGDEVANAILTPNGGRGGIGVGATLHGMAVRRLTPEECEALQGFPRGYTQVPYRGKPAADGPRYKALGNSMAVPVMRWIGQQIQAVEVASLPEGERWLRTIGDCDERAEHQLENSKIGAKP